MVYEALRKLDSLASIEARLRRTYRAPAPEDTGAGFLSDAIPAVREPENGFNIVSGDVVEWSHQDATGTVTDVSETHFRVTFPDAVHTYDGRQFVQDKITKRAHALTIADTGEFVQFWPVPEPIPAPVTPMPGSGLGSISVEQAIEIINTIVYLPDWRITAEPYTYRFQDGVLVHVNYEARNSDRSEAPAYANWTPGGGRADFVIQITGLDTREDVAHKLITEVIMPIWEHETREFVRFPDTLDAPFHPHNSGPMTAWGTPLVDIKFGAA